MAGADDCCRFYKGMVHIYSLSSFIRANLALSKGIWLYLSSYHQRQPTDPLIDAAERYEQAKRIYDEI